MTPRLRMTANTRKVLRELARRDGLFGAQIGRTTKVPPGTLYPLLARLQENGLATSEWEDHGDTDPGTPRRRFYTLTEAGRQKAKEIVP